MTDTALAARVEALYKANPRQMTMQMARELAVPEANVIRYLPGGISVELDPKKAEALLRGLEPLGKVHVICTTGAATLEVHGQFGGFSSWGEFFNVQTPSLDMHIRLGRLGSVFAVEKPSHMDGINTLSFQFFDTDGHAAFKVFLTFGQKGPSPERLAVFNELRDACRLARV